MDRNTGRGKVAYNWISPDPAKAGPTLGVVVVYCPIIIDYGSDRLTIAIGVSF